MPPPNILVFMTDHQRADTALPEHPAITPNLDRLVADGVAFTETYCPTPHCCPARATFFSGLYPTRHGVWNNICNGQRLSPGLNDGVRLFSEDLADAGYRLSWSGKWHVDTRSGPADRGWKEHYVSADASAYHGESWQRYRDLAREPRKSDRAYGELLRPGYGDRKIFGECRLEDHVHDNNVMDGALSALRELTGGDGPWGLYVGLGGPHDPYVVPKKYVDMYDLDEVPLPPSFADEMGDKPGVYRRMRRQAWGQMSEREYRDAIRHFWAYCTLLDERFGELLDRLEESGQAENTLVLYCSDHADYCGEHGLFAKGIPCFRGAYHVPAVARWPAGIRHPGRRVDDLVSLADFAPTFLDLAGVCTDRYFTGSSLAPFLRDERPDDWRDALFTQCNGVELYYTQRSVMTRDHKYVFNGFDEDELYDLRNDPHETRNLALDPAYGEIKRDLVRRMWRFAHQEQDTATNAYVTVALAPWGPAEAFREG